MKGTSGRAALQEQRLVRDREAGSEPQESRKWRNVRSGPPSRRETAGGPAGVAGASVRFCPPQPCIRVLAESWEWSRTELRALCSYDFRPTLSTEGFSALMVNQDSTVLAIAGEDFSIVASDTRLSEGFSIHTRDSPKCYKLTDKTVIGCSGFHGDCLTLTKIIEARLKMYKHSNNKAMTTGAIAAMLSTILYSRRFFPYYVYNIIGGLDEEGKGAVYSFDPVGSYQRDSFKAGGSASAMLQPLLDNQVGFKNMQNVEHVPLSLDRAMRLVKDVFISAAERDVYTGDALRICIVTKEGIREETVPLRKD
ncbi:Proteasome subunit beta type-1 [Saguinus oedipus]|uniref:Proteasome subunit beta n=1 Tax=Saguinus oedipus TaxID=9490 RepID=A0ABQ9VZQ7_SAGOE|nr:Proteasome subunit beta type-1 [Saguinus oedipus]